MLRSLRTVSLLVAGLTASTANAQVQMYEYEGILSNHLGWAVASVGDVDADGYQDFAVGSPEYGNGFSVPNHAGLATIHSGRTGDVIRNHVGLATGDNFGYSIDGIGDINLDGFADYIVGAPFRDSLGMSDNGAVYVYSGKNGSMLQSHYGQHDGDTAGTSVTGLGDVSGDGRPDYAYGASNGDLYQSGVPSVIDAGIVYARSGANHTSLWAGSHGEAYSYYGTSIDGIDDANGDGIPDLVVGAPYYDHPSLGPDSGRVWVISGANGTMVTKFGAGYGGGHLGQSVAGLGDVDKDGVPDIIAGAPTADANGTDSGVFWVWSALGGSPLWAYSGVAGSQSGSAVASMGDVDGDGFLDFAYGAPKQDFPGSLDAGAVIVRSGKNGTILYTLAGPTGSQMGNAIASLDVNKDGHHDLLAGAAAHFVTFSGAGLARLYLLGVDAPTSYCTAKVNSAGCTPKISYSGDTSLLTGSDLSVHASSILKNVPGLMIWSRTSNAVPFGGGTLCLGGPVKRTSGQTSGPGVLGFPCSGSFRFDIGLGFAITNSVLSGDTIFTQFWSRDTGFAPPNNMNLTDGLEITFVP